MKPPRMAGLLGFFDCRAVDPLAVARHQGYAADPRTGQRVDLGFAAAVPLTSLLDRPYSTRPVEGDERREFAEYGDRLRDARWLWADARVRLTAGRDGSSPGDGEVQGDVVSRDDGSEFVVTRVLEDGKVAGLRGYLLLRRQT